MVKKCNRAKENYVRLKLQNKAIQLNMSEISINLNILNFLINSESNSKYWSVCFLLRTYLKYNYTKVKKKFMKANQIKLKLM
jgi:3-methyladenine DNA glycosylase AlkC